MSHESTMRMSPRDADMMFVLREGLLCDGQCWQDCTLKGSPHVHQLGFVLVWQQASQSHQA